MQRLQRKSNQKLPDLRISHCTANRCLFCMDYWYLLLNLTLFFPFELLILHQARPEWPCLMQWERDWRCGRCVASVCLCECVFTHACSQAVSGWVLVGLHRCSCTEGRALLSRLMFAWLIWMCKCLYETRVQGHSSPLSIILIKPNFPQRLYRQLF